MREDLEQYESDLELQLYREYKDVVGIFTYAVETERRFYLCNAVDLKVRTEGGDVYYEVSMGDAWVWDMYRPARFVKSAKVLTFRDVSIEEIAHSELQVPKRDLTPAAPDLVATCRFPTLRGKPAPDIRCNVCTARGVWAQCVAWDSRSARRYRATGSSPRTGS